PGSPFWRVSLLCGSIMWYSAGHIHVWMYFPAILHHGPPRWSAMVRQGRHGPPRSSNMRRRSFVKHTAALSGAALAGLNLSPEAAAGSAESAAASGTPNPAPRSGNAGARADLVLRRALIHDGSGDPAVRGDVAVSRGRIVEVGARVGAQGDREIDLDGLALAPGFIDIHSHTDLSLLRDPRADSKVRQGVTTEVAGQDGGSVGWSEAGFREARERYAGQGIDLDFRDVAGFLR